MTRPEPIPALDLSRFISCLLARPEAIPIIKLSSYIHNTQYLKEKN